MRNQRRESRTVRSVADARVPSHAVDPAGETGLDLAFPLAIEAYRTSERRQAVVEGRLRDLVGLALLLTMVVTVVLRHRVESSAWPFWAAILLFGAGLLVSTYGYFSGGLQMPAIHRLYQDYCGLSGREFKQAFVYWSGEHDAKNARAIARKARISEIAAYLFLAEGLLLATWGIGLSNDRAANQPIQVYAAGAAR